MFRSKTVFLCLLPIALAGCSASQPSVPMVGPAAEVSALIGEWSGDYSSGESGRAGSISFTLRATSDSAFGDVVMIPSASGIPLQPWRAQDTGQQPGQQPTGANQAPQSTVLKIRFVRVEQGKVSGSLDPYADPQTGARLHTTFSGEIKGNSIAGSYSTMLPSGETQTGRWSVERRKA